jgi:hypothetical protein
MTSVALTTVWLNLASDLTDNQSFPMMSKLSVTPERPGEAREYANGRIRLVRKGAQKTTFNVTLPLCTRDQIEWIEANTGELMLIRDDRGRKVWGTYFKPSIDEVSEDTDAGDVEFTFVEITHSEAL